ncbi:conserved hypothetical protein [Paraburkholderia unamae]|uniref:hypothetical protein n=1 Tax=Paraburkholderia unamae TaxID=219649 RepID=UPI001CAEFA48|nr:hypothetical protein [Paraburkholderia unamae]CAG9258529.1 conserved hypothetical protein [Paraburkholderia unamae]
MIEFARHPLKIAHINVRSETHGDEEVIAVDLKLSFELPNTVLDTLSPSLRVSLFDAANDPDIFEGEDGPPLTRVRHPHLGVLRWSETWRAMRLHLHTGARARDDLAFDDVTLGKLAMRPREGGTVAFDARAQVHPKTEAVTAKLVTLLKREVPATLDASEATDESEADD